MGKEDNVKVLNFGSLNLDYVYHVHHFVMPGETLSAKSQKINCGGKGLNQSVALAHAGAKVYHAGCVGRGGEPLKIMLEQSGVDTQYLEGVDEIQGNAVIQVNESGENCILLFGGSNQCVEKQQIERTLSGFAEGDYLILQNEVNALPMMVDMAYERGMKIVLNPSPYDEKLKKVDFAKISWLLVNEVEAEQISGSSDPQNVWQILHDRYPRLSLVITQGKAGSICYSGKQCCRQEAYAVKTVDTTAAGDTFTGFFIAGLMEGMELSRCMKYAAIASAISVTREGAAPSIPTKEETEEWIKRKMGEESK